MRSEFPGQVNRKTLEFEQTVSKVQALQQRNCSNFQISQNASYNFSLRKPRILGVEKTGTSQNTFPPFGRRMIQKFHFSGRQFTALLGLDPEWSIITIIDHSKRI